MCSFNLKMKFWGFFVLKRSIDMHLITVHKVKEGMVDIDAVFCNHAIEGYSKWKKKKPDTDNYLKEKRTKVMKNFEEYLFLKIREKCYITQKMRPRDLKNTHYIALKVKKMIEEGVSTHLS